MASTKRIRYIDALRGFTMFLVVFGHVLNYSFQQFDSVLSQFFVTFRMPTFFFISGFIAYKAIDRWTGAFYRQCMKKKAVVQLVPATVFCVIYLLTQGHNPLTFIPAHGVMEYWFTYVLFEMFCVYFLLSLIGRGTTHLVVDAVMILLSVAGVAAMALCDYEAPLWKVTMLDNLCRYFQFFTFGILWRKYAPRTMALLADDRFKTAVIAVFLLSFMAYMLPQSASRLPHTVYMLLKSVVARYAGLLTVLAFFVSHADYFERDNRVTRVMLFVGRRTLDIYLLHFFFLPDLEQAARWWGMNDRIVVQLTVAVAVAAVIVALCLLVSAVLRASRTLSYYCFGVKPRD